MTLQWEKVNNTDNHTYELEYMGKKESIRPQNDSLVEYPVKNLSSGTEFFFTLYTVFEGVKSSGYNFTNVTGKSQYIWSVALTY